MAVKCGIFVDLWEILLFYSRKPAQNEKMGKALVVFFFLLL